MAGWPGEILKSWGKDGCLIEWEKCHYSGRLEALFGLKSATIPRESPEAFRKPLYIYTALFYLYKNKKGDI